MKERLQKILSARGVASRRRGEELIRGGRVSVNGIPASLGDCADPELDEILLDGKPLPRQQEWETFVAAFQQCAANATSDEKWQMMDRMFYLY